MTGVTSSHMHDSDRGRPGETHDAGHNDSGKCDAMMITIPSN